MIKPGKYRIIYKKSVVKEDIPSLPKNVKNTIKQAIAERLTSNPIEFGKPLHYSVKGYRRLRVGHYRVVYKINDDFTVTIAAIKHRKDVYDE